MEQNDKCVLALKIWRIPSWVAPYMIAKKDNTFFSECNPKNFHGFLGPYSNTVKNNVVFMWPWPQGWYLSLVIVYKVIVNNDSD